MGRTLVALALLGLAGCALRPRYGEVVTAVTPGPTAQFQLLDANTGLPVAEATVELGEGRSKLMGKTDAQGLFTLPVEKKLRDENSILVINPPAGFGRTKVVAAAPKAVEAPVAVDVLVDAGS
jgi:hypothetical protein